MNNQNSDVTAFLDTLDHPFRREIEQLRAIILVANKGLTENLKWNGPNYCYEGEDRITMKIQPPAKQVLLIFHRGTKKYEQPKAKMIGNNSKLLAWKENDRAIITFKSLEDIENAKEELEAIINQWIDATIGLG